MNRYRLRSLALGLTAVLGVLTACEQQGQWQLQSLDPASEGATGAILVTDAAFVYDAPVKGGTVYQVGDTVPLQTTIVNRGSTDDRLLSVRSPIAAEVELRGTRKVAAGKSLVVGYNDPIASVGVDEATSIDIQLNDLRKPVRSGLTYPVVFTFADGGKLRLEVGVQNPDTAREECPLPPEGVPPKTLVAPAGDAPSPDGPPVPGCSSLGETPEVEILHAQAPLSHLTWAPKHLALLGLVNSGRGRRLVRLDPLTGNVVRSREIEGAGENFGLISHPVERIALPLTEAGGVALLEVETLEVKRISAVGVRPSWLAVHNPSKSLFVLSADGSTVTGVDYEHGEPIFRLRVDAGERAIVEPANEQEEPAFWLATPDGFTYFAGQPPKSGPSVQAPLDELTFTPGTRETLTAYQVAADDPGRVLRRVRTPTGDLARAASNAVSASVKHITAKSGRNRVYAVTEEKVITMRADTLKILAVTDYRAALEKAPEDSLADAVVADVAASEGHLFLALEGEPHIVEVRTSKK